MRSALIGAAAAAFVAGTAMADTGDLYKVSGERANLRSAPTDQATVRGSLAAGDQVIELRNDGRWLGVRVLRTGEEGWIWGPLLQRVSQSGLSGSSAPMPEAGFGKLSADFDRLLAASNDAVGTPMVARLEQHGGRLLVVPTDDWTYATGRDAKLYAALALYEMWKNYNNGRPVELALGSPDTRSVTIADGDQGPQLRFGAGR